MQFDGYEYRKKAISADGRTQFWVCPVKSCPGRAHSPIGTENLVIKTAHNHVRSETQLVVRQRKEQVKDMAQNNLATAPRDIYIQSRQGMTN